MRYEECLAYLEASCPRGKGGGMIRTRAMLDQIGHIEQDIRIIHVAGTNGKGSTCAMLESILRAHGKRVGFFISPHLEDYRERIQINREMISQEEFAKFFTKLVEEVIPAMMKAGYEHPGEFEMLYVLGVMYFVHQTDVVIMEVGLGGELDPTNVSEETLVSVITSIGFDHVGTLGTTLGEIAAAKAGIAKKNGVLVTAQQRSEAMKAIENVCKERHTRLILQQHHVDDADVQQWFQKLALRGEYQKENCLLVLQVVAYLREMGWHITDEEIGIGLAQVQWAGRMEYHTLEDGKEILLDGAHNQDGIDRLSEELARQKDRGIVLLLGILDDKDQWEMTQKIIRYARMVVVTKPSEERSANWAQLEEFIRKEDQSKEVYHEESVEKAILLAMEHQQSGELLCMTGSLHLIGACETILKSCLKKVREK